MLIFATAYAAMALLFIWFYVYVFRTPYKKAVLNESTNKRINKSELKCACQKFAHNFGKVY